MGQIKLWGVPKSIHVQKVLRALEPERPHPHLADDGAPIWESNARATG